jgi:hypothetical protein
LTALSTLARSDIDVCSVQDHQKKIPEVNVKGLKSRTRHPSWSEDFEVLAPGKGSPHSMTQYNVFYAKLAAVVISKDFVDFFHTVSFYSPDPRIIIVDLFHSEEARRTKEPALRIISGYSPTSSNDSRSKTPEQLIAERDRFYDELKLGCGKVPDRTILGGDFNVTLHRQMPLAESGIGPDGFPRFSTQECVNAPYYLGLLKNWTGCCAANTIRLGGRKRRRLATWFNARRELNKKPHVKDFLVVPGASKCTVRKHLCIKPLKPNQAPLGPCNRKKLKRKKVRRFTKIGKFGHLSDHRPIGALLLLQVPRPPISCSQQAKRGGYRRDKCQKMLYTDSLYRFLDKRSPTHPIPPEVDRVAEHFREKLRLRNDEIPAMDILLKATQELELEAKDLARRGLIPCPSVRAWLSDEALAAYRSYRNSPKAYDVKLLYRYRRLRDRDFNAYARTKAAAANSSKNLKEMWVHWKDFKSIRKGLIDVNPNQIHKHFATLYRNNENRHSEIDPMTPLLPDLELDDVRAAAMSLNVNTALGMDGIHPRLARDPSVYTFLHRVLKTVPCKDLTEHAKTRLVLLSKSSGNTTAKCPSMTRAIGVMPMLLRLADRCTPSAKKRRLLDRGMRHEQFGFRTNRSCTLANHIIQSYSLAARLTNRRIIGASLDVHKAFDSVEPTTLHQILVAKEVDARLPIWLSQNLSYHFRPNRGTNKPIYPTRGITQGGCNSPLFFTLMIDEIAEQFAQRWQALVASNEALAALRGRFEVRLYTYADDIFILVEENERDTLSRGEITMILSQAMLLFKACLEEKDFSLNVAKTKAVGNVDLNTLNAAIHGLNQTDQCYEFKHLGIITSFPQTPFESRSRCWATPPNFARRHLLYRRWVPASRVTRALLFRRSGSSLTTFGHILRQDILPALLYGIEAMPPSYDTARRVHDYLIDIATSALGRPSLIRYGPRRNQNLDQNVHWKKVLQEWHTKTMAEFTAKAGLRCFDHYYTSRLVGHYQRCTAQLRANPHDDWRIILNDERTSYWTPSLQRLLGDVYWNTYDHTFDPSGFLRFTAGRAISACRSLWRTASTKLSLFLSNLSPSRNPDRTDRQPDNDRKRGFGSSFFDVLERTFPIQESVEAVKKGMKVVTDRFKVMVKSNLSSCVSFHKRLTRQIPPPR